MPEGLRQSRAGWTARAARLRKAPSPTRGPTPPAASLRKANRRPVPRNPAPRPQKERPARCRRHPAPYARHRRRATRPRPQALRPGHRILPVSPTCACPPSHACCAATQADGRTTRGSCTREASRKAGRAAGARRLRARPQWSRRRRARAHPQSREPALRLRRRRPHGPGRLPPPPCSRDCRGSCRCRPSAR